MRGTIGSTKLRLYKYNKAGAERADHLASSNLNLGVTRSLKHCVLIEQPYIE